MLRNFRSMLLLTLIFFLSKLAGDSHRKLSEQSERFSREFRASYLFSISIAFSNCRSSSFWDPVMNSMVSFSKEAMVV